MKPIVLIAILAIIGIGISVYFIYQDEKAKAEDKAARLANAARLAAITQPISTTTK